LTEHFGVLPLLAEITWTISSADIRGGYRESGIRNR
jgi:hypothetical protein